MRKQTPEKQVMKSGSQLSQNAQKAEPGFEPGSWDLEMGSINRKLSKAQPAF